MGYPPFDGGAAQVMFAHLQQPPKSVSTAIKRALAKNPDERFAS